MTRPEPAGHPARRSLWQPKDYDDTTLGLIPMRQSLFPVPQPVDDQLGMSIRRADGIGEVRRYGITTALPPYPSITSAPRA